jgi:ubiquinone/menaquinone biosynthesis C-methylase UbiE
VLEIGGGSGEHLQYIDYIPINSYKSLDLREPTETKYLEFKSQEFREKFEFIVGDAQDLDFDENTFDRVFSTCLLHHVDDVMAVLTEARRVTMPGGELMFVFPTDPGLLNQLVKHMISYPKIRKITNIRPELINALGHKNHALGIKELIKYVFRDDQLEFHFRPFFVKSINLNLLVAAHITKKT